MPAQTIASLKLNAAIKEHLHQEALAVWEAYQATGLHVTAEEADAWLAKLEAGEDAELPEFHD